MGRGRPLWSTVSIKDIVKTLINHIYFRPEANQKTITDQGYRDILIDDEYPPPLLNKKMLKILH